MYLGVELIMHYYAHCWIYDKNIFFDLYDKCTFLDLK
jgi:hypothetical protein